MLSYAFEMNLYGRTVANLTNVHRGGTVQLHCVLHKKSTFLVRVIAVLHRYIYICHNTIYSNDVYFNSLYCHNTMRHLAVTTSYTQP